MNKDAFKSFFTLDYINQHIQLWLRSEGLAGRLPQTSMTAEELQDALAKHEDAPVMLQEALEYDEQEGPLSPTATDLLFTYLDTFRTSKACH